MRRLRSRNTVRALALFLAATFLPGLAAPLLAAHRGDARLYADWVADRIGEHADTAVLNVLDEEASVAHASVEAFVRSFVRATAEAGLIDALHRALSDAAGQSGALPDLILSAFNGLAPSPVAATTRLVGGDTPGTLPVRSSDDARVASVAADADAHHTSERTVSQHGPAAHPPQSGFLTVAQPNGP